MDSPLPARCLGRAAAGPARAAAECTDPALRRQRYPLLGVPFAVKDNIDIAGSPPPPPARPSPTWRTQTRQRGAAPARGRRRGVDRQDQPRPVRHRPGRHPDRPTASRPCVADPERISGGSSSGSAVAWWRAARCLLAGHRHRRLGPRAGRLQRTGRAEADPGRVGTAAWCRPAARWTACRSSRTTASTTPRHVLAVLEGPDPADPYSAFAPGPARLVDACIALGVPNRPVFHGDAGYEPAWPRALARARELGHELVPIDFEPLHAVAALLYDGPWVAERHAVVRTCCKRQPEAFDPTVQAGDRTRAGLRRHRTRSRRSTGCANCAPRWPPCGSEVDAAAGAHRPPATRPLPRSPPTLSAPTRGWARYTNFVNLLGWCALAVPAGHTGKGLPFGVTFIAPAAATRAGVHAGKAWLRREHRRADPAPAGQPLRRSTSLSSERT
jgi:allophanate hydrolase